MTKREEILETRRKIRALREKEKRQRISIGKEVCGYKIGDYIRDIRTGEVFTFFDIGKIGMNLSTLKTIFVIPVRGKRGRGIRTEIDYDPKNWEKINRTGLNSIFRMDDDLKVSIISILKVAARGEMIDKEYAKLILKKLTGGEVK